MEPIFSQNVLKTQVSITNYRHATNQILNWAKGFESRYVCVANVHMVMEAYDNPDFQEVVNEADMVVPDGMPLVWALRRKGHDLKDRVYGPTLTLWVLKEAARHGVPVGFYGGAPDVLETLVKNISNKFPDLQIAYSYSPPFRELTQKEKEGIVKEINESGTRILFVGLGCPKQEKWMHSHKDIVQAVMIGVGAAFDFHAGKVRQAPAWAKGCEKQ